MKTFRIKTHRASLTYSEPHFFILNKGLNSGKPLNNPCPNCFVCITTDEVLKILCTGFASDYGNQNHSITI